MTLVQSISDVLKNIDPLEFNINETLAVLKTVARIPQKNPEPKADEILKHVLVRLAMYKYENVQLHDKLADLLQYIDTEAKATVSNMLSEITDYTTAFDAYNKYDADWFSSKPYSLDLKMEIANNLVQACQPYNLVLDFWVNLSNYQAAATTIADFSSKDIT
jgi:hypothetical protein